MISQIQRFLPPQFLLPICQRKKKNRSFQFKNGGGFSLIELMVVVTIIVIITLIIIPNYRQISSQFALERSAHKLAQDIRRAAEMAMSARELPGSGPQPKGYGVFFSTGSDGGNGEAGDDIKNKEDGLEFGQDYFLNHRLEEDKQGKINITVGATKIRNTNKKVLGVAFFLPGDAEVGEYNGQPECDKIDGPPCRYGLPIDRYGTYTLKNYPTGDFESVIKNLQLQMTRVYEFDIYDRWFQAGKGGEQYFTLFDAKTALDKWHELAKNLDIPEKNIVIALGLYTTAEDKSTIYPPVDFWKELVEYSVKEGYGFKHWEIGNEVYLPFKEEGTGYWKNGFFDKDDLEETINRFAPYFIEVSEAIKEVQPEAKIGISINGMAGLDNVVDEGDDDYASYDWSKDILRDVAGHYDFIAGHYYGIGCNEVADDAFEQFTLALNYATLQLQLDVLKYANQLEKNKYTIYHYDTEWGASATRDKWDPETQQCGPLPSQEVRNGNLYGTIQRAIRLIYYLREGIVEGASTWNMISRDPDLNEKKYDPGWGPGYGFITPRDPNNRSMAYWLYYYFNQYLGDSVLEVDGTAPYYSAIYNHWPWKEVEIKGPYTPVLATKSQDGIYLIIANANENNSYDFKVNLEDFQGSETEATLFTDYRNTGWKDNPPFSTNENDFAREYAVTLSGDGKELTGDLPARSVLFIKITAA